MPFLASFFLDGGIMAAFLAVCGLCLFTYCTRSELFFFVGEYLSLVPPRYLSQNHRSGGMWACYLSPLAYLVKRIMASTMTTTSSTAASNAPTMAPPIKAPLLASTSEEKYIQYIIHHRKLEWNCHHQKFAGMQHLYMCACVLYHRMVWALHWNFTCAWSVWTLMLRHARLIIECWNGVHPTFLPSL